MNAEVETVADRVTRAAAVALEQLAIAPERLEHVADPVAGETYVRVWLDLEALWGGQAALVCVWDAVADRVWRNEPEHTRTVLFSVRGGLHRAERAA